LFDDVASSSNEKLKRIRVSSVSPTRPRVKSPLRSTKNEEFKHITKNLKESVQELMPQSRNSTSPVKNLMTPDN
jgi:hypothetical protein